MKDLIELEYKKMALENKWRSEFEALKSLFEDVTRGDADDVMAAIISIKEKSDSCKFLSLVEQIDLWIKDQKVYALEDYLTRQEFERIIERDCYYLRKEFVRESFFDGDTFSTILTASALLDQWISSGLPLTEGCPWGHSFNGDCFYREDCKDFGSFCIEVRSIRRFLSSHKLPVPAAIFPNDPQNTFFVLSRIERTMDSFAEMRSREREMLELKELRQKSEYCVSNVQTDILSSPGVEVLPKVTTTISATLNMNTPGILIARLREEGVKEPRELAAQVDKHFPGLSDSALGRLLPAHPGIAVSWNAENSRGRRLRGKK